MRKDWPPIKMEVCADNLESVKNAQKGGASRIELCSALSEGGLTPSLGFFLIAKQVASTIPIFCMLRPRGGDFMYSPDEIEVMVKDAQLFGQNGASGLVLGVLKSNGSFDSAACKRIINAASSINRSMEFTFHRAFDVMQNPLESAEEIRTCGFSRILTSGQKKNAQSGIPLIRELVKKFKNCNFHIVPGCGINEGNLKEILEATGAAEFHASARSIVQSAMEFKNENCSMGSDSSEYSLMVTSEEKVHCLKSIYDQVRHEII